MKCDEGDSIKLVLLCRGYAVKYILLFVAIILSPQVLAQTSPWGDAGGWTINISSETSSACFATRLMEDNSEVHIGFDPAHEGGYLAVYNAAWTHIEEGQTSVVEFDFGDARFAGEAEARFLQDVPGGYAFFNNPAFVEAFARKNSVRVKGSKGAEFELVLDGTHKAIVALRKCQKEQNANDEKDK